MKSFRILLLLLTTQPVFAETNEFPPQSIETTKIIHFADNPPNIKKLLNFLTQLTHQNLTYQYGSADPKNGGMDCSGTVFYSLNAMGIKNTPRSSFSMYQWVNDKGDFHSVTDYTLDSPQFATLKPGDLLFWSGTYQTQNIPNVSHVMIYLGKNNQGQPLMLGASNGRTYQGKKIYGVSVFDFQLPKPSQNSRFLGFSCIPQFSCEQRKEPL